MIGKLRLCCSISAEKVHFCHRKKQKKIQSGKEPPKQPKKIEYSLLGTKQGRIRVYKENLLELGFWGLKGFRWNELKRSPIYSSSSSRSSPAVSFLKESAVSESLGRKTELLWTDIFYPSKEFTAQDFYISRKRLGGSQVPIKPFCVSAGLCKITAPLGAWCSWLIYYFSTNLSSLVFLYISLITSRLVLLFFPRNIESNDF